MKSAILLFACLFLTKISFSQIISNEEAIKTHVKNAQEYESIDLKKEAAEEWLAAWELDRKKIEYAHHAIRIYVDRREYVQAMEVLTAPELSNDKKAKDLISKLNATPEMTAIANYQESMKLADFHMSTENFEQAKAAYQKALQYKRNDTEATVKLNYIKEESAWKKANSLKDPTSLEHYIGDYPSGKHIAEAKSSLKVEYIRLAKQYAAERRLGLLENIYRKTNKFLEGDSDKQVENQLSSLYIHLADSLYHNKNWSEATAGYDRYLITLPKGSKASYATARIKRIEQIQKNIANQKNGGFFIYTYDAISPIGISFGSLNVKGAGIGYYINIKMTKHVFKELGEIEKTTSQELTDYQTMYNYHWESEQGNFGVSGGLTVKIIYPLWVYGGFGVGYNLQYEKVFANYVNSEDKGDHEWMRNTDFKKIDYAPEVGLLFKPGKAFVLKYGISYNKKATHQLGIGFQM